MRYTKNSYVGPLCMYVCRLGGMA